MSFYASLAEIISALAVVASLIFVGIQIRQNTRATQASMRQSIADNDIDYLITFLDNSILAHANAKSIAGDSLSPVEWEQLVAQQHVNFRVFENAHYQYQNGLLDDEVWQRYRVIIELLLTSDSAARELWSSRNYTFTPAFQEEIESINR